MKFWKRRYHSWVLAWPMIEKSPNHGMRTCEVHYTCLLYAWIGRWILSMAFLSSLILVLPSSRSVISWCTECAKTSPLLDNSTWSWPNPNLRSACLYLVLAIQRASHATISCKLLWLHDHFLIIWIFLYWRWNVYQVLLQHYWIYHTNRFALWLQNPFERSRIADFWLFPMRQNDPIQILSCQRN